MVQKFYAIKTGPAIKQGAIISTIFAFVVAVDPISSAWSPLRGQIEYAANGTPIYDSIIPTMRCPPCPTCSMRRRRFRNRAVGLNVDALVYVSRRHLP